MEQIIIRVRDSDKAKLLREVLQALDFVDMVDSESQVEKIKTEDFFEFAGIWKDRDIDLTTLRKKAWPRQR